MKIRLRYLLASILTAGSMVATPAFALAHEGEVKPATTTTTTTQTEETSAEAKAKRKARLDKAKLDFKVKLTAVASARIKERCVNAQSQVAKLNDKFGNSVTKRTKAYEALQSRLDKLVTKLKEKGVDTATLEQQITELDTKITTYNTDLDAYKQSLVDLKEVDCKTDPDAFKAALEASRAAHVKIVEDVTGIRTFLKDTIKPTLKEILTSLEKSETDSESDNQETEQEPASNTTN
jgi:hypothetical protein